jgi:cytidylate kinase
MAKITIFGLAGTGKTDTSLLVAKALGYPVLSTGNMFREMAKEAGYTDLHKFEEEVCQKDPDHDAKLDTKTAEYGRTHLDFVFESRLAWHFIPDSFKIMLVCPGEARFERVAKRENKSIEQAKAETLAREKSIFTRFEEYYHIADLNDESQFDLVINTNDNNLEQVVKIILDELEKRGLAKPIQSI